MEYFNIKEITGLKPDENGKESLKLNQLRISNAYKVIYDAENKIDEYDFTPEQLYAYIKAINDMRTDVKWYQIMLERRIKEDPDINNENS